MRDDVDSLMAEREVSTLHPPLDSIKSVPSLCLLRDNVMRRIVLQAVMTGMNRPLGKEELMRLHMLLTKRREAYFAARVIQRQFRKKREVASLLKEHLADLDLSSLAQLHATLDAALEPLLERQQHDAASTIQV